MLNATLHRLQTLRVRDIMSRSVVAIQATQTMVEAANTLLAHEISGAPVLDDQGRCVGILSAGDFVKNLSDAQLTGGEARHRVVRDLPDGPFRLDAIGGERVSAHMSPAVQSIQPDALLLDAARIMCAQHVHRLPVIAPDGHALGMVTALDMAAVLVNLFDQGMQPE